MTAKLRLPALLLLLCAMGRPLAPTGDRLGGRSARGSDPPPRAALPAPHAVFLVRAFGLLPAGA
ncbi:MAG: hypothetical protein HY784_16555 [Chloroflexi bacterium]|nr:hypothetical protein [Chloroflexota bacterium]